MGLEQQRAGAFTRAFRGHPSGVAIISAITVDGPVGLTASSIASVAIDLPALSFLVMRGSRSAGAVLRADTFVVQLIDDRHADLARVLAVPGAERFTPEQGWQTLPTGEPYLPGARVAMRCRPLDVVTVGASSLVVAEVLQVHSGDGSAEALPLVHHDQRFRVLIEDRPR